MSEAAVVEDDWEFYTDLSVGEILRRTRIHYGQSLDDIERILRIRASQLAALENGNVEQLPGRVYAIGFVRSYSEYLGLDGDKMVHLFKVQSVGGKNRPELAFPVPASESRTPDLWIILVSAVSVLLIMAGWFLFSETDRSMVSEIPSVPESMQAGLSDFMKAGSGAGASATHTQSPDQNTGQQKMSGENNALPEGAAPARQSVDDVAERPANEAGETGRAGPAPAPSSATDSDPLPDFSSQARIVLEVTQTSWVEIRNKSGKAVLSTILRAGDKYLVPDEEGLRMTTGNAGGVTITVDGRSLPSLGETGDVRRNIALDPEYLLKKLR